MEMYGHPSGCSPYGRTNLRYYRWTKDIHHGTARDGLVKNPTFTQAVATTGAVHTRQIGAQNAVNGGGNVIGKGDVGAQTEQVLKNIDLVGVGRPGPHRDRGDRRGAGDSEVGTDRLLRE